MDLTLYAQRPRRVRARLPAGSRLPFFPQPPALTPRLRTGEVTDEEVAEALLSLGPHYAVLDALGYAAGTALTWQSSGGTFAITCTSLAAGASRQGAKSTTLVTAPPLGLSTAVLPDFLQVKLQCQFVGTITAGREVAVYLSFSSSATAGTDNPGSLSGTDAAGPNADVFPQLVFAGALVGSANLTTNAQEALLAPVRPLDAYVSPVIYNNTDQNFDGTALHTVLTLTPYYRERSS